MPTFDSLPVTHRSLSRTSTSQSPAIPRTISPSEGEIVLGIAGDCDVEVRERLLCVTGSESNVGIFDELRYWGVLRNVCRGEGTGQGGRREEAEGQRREPKNHGAE